mgnify:CR=1 FL=1
MRVIIRNNTDLPQRYARFIKQKIAQVKKKFSHLLYAEVYLSQEGKSNSVYKTVVKLGVAGQDIVLTNSSESLTVLWRETFGDVRRYLRKYKERNRRQRVAVGI